jgi:hypothetical protein
MILNSRWCSDDIGEKNVVIGFTIVGRGIAGIIKIYFYNGNYSNSHL